MWSTRAPSETSSVEGNRERHGFPFSYAVAYTDDQCLPPDQERKRSRKAAPEFSLGWSRNGGTLGKDGTESSPERAQGTMAQTLARIFVHVVFSTKDRAPLAYALSGLPAGVCEPRASPCFTLATIRAALRAPAQDRSGSPGVIMIRCPLGVVSLVCRHIRSRERQSVPMVPIAHPATSESEPRAPVSGHVAIVATKYLACHQRSRRSCLPSHPRNERIRAAGGSLRAPPLRTRLSLRHAPTLQTATPTKRRRPANGHVESRGTACRAQNCEG